MKPVAILSSTTDPDYLFCIPIVAKSWNLQGFDVFVRVIGDRDLPIRKYVGRNALIVSPSHGIKSIPEAMESQIIRIWDAGQFEDATPAIIGDADMFIASDFLYKRFDLINVFGKDLTDYHIPMCYVCMKSSQWLEIIGREDIMDLIKQYGRDNSWCYDQDILTGLLKDKIGFENINFISRGTDPNNHGLPLGRWDRYGGFRKPQGQVHDCHLPRKPYSKEMFPLIYEMCKDIYPFEDWTWLYEYRKEFIKEFLQETEYA